MNEWKASCWLETDGSPFILIGQPYADDWDGQGDYEAACGVTDYAGKMYKKGHPVVVLGDEPMAIRVIQKDDFIHIVRWHYAPGRAYADQLLATNLTDGLESIETMEIEWGSTRLALFDASYPYTEAPARLFLTLPNDQCTIKTYHYARADTSFIIHTIRPSR